MSRALAAPATLGLTFGADKTSPFLDFQRVDGKTLFESNGHYGWLHENGLHPQAGRTSDKYCTVAPDALVEHVIFVEGNTLRVKLPEGRYHVHLWTGSWGRFVRPWFRPPRPTNRHYHVIANGVKVIDEPLPDGSLLSERWLCRGMRTLIRPRRDLWAQTIQKCFDEYDFPVDVSRGVLDIEFTDIFVDGLLICPRGPPFCRLPEKWSLGGSEFPWALS